MENDRLERVEREIRHHPDPVVSAPELADVDALEDLARRQVLDELRLLERAGAVESKKVGGNAVAWWHTERVTPAPPRDPADHPDQRALEETVDEHAHNARGSDRSELHSECNSDRSSRGDRDLDRDADVELVDDLDGELERALGDWSPGRSRQERRERRRSGIAVLEWLRDRHGPPATRADVVEELFDEHGINGQSPDTWWRRVVRPALNRAADAGLVDASGKTYEWTGTEGK